VNWIRSFSEQSAGASGARNLEDAPQPMRQELVDLFFSLAEHSQDEVPPEHVYRVTCQSLGISASGIPYGGYRYASGRDVNRVEWPRIYDLIARLWPDFDRHGHGRLFREGTNRILAAYGVAWEQGDDGRLNRVLPVAAQVQVNEAFAELHDPGFEPALDLFRAGRDAFDARPRRDRDACSNVFDALESVAKEKYAMPNATYGQVVARLRADANFNADIVALLSGLNDLRNHNFGHGMTTQFNLTSAEVDFTYLACIGAILLLARTPSR
jgi:hypothetical protein